MPDYEIITDGGRRRRWTSSEKLRIVEGEALPHLEENASISVVARRNGVAPTRLVSLAASDAGGRGCGRVWRR